MNRYFLKILIFAFIILLSINGIGMDKETVFNLRFFRKFSSKSALSRDDYLYTYTNHIIIARGSIRTVLEKSEYKKKYVIVIESDEAVKYGQKFIYQVYLNKMDTIDLLSENTYFEFKGQFMGFTPINTRRDEYIIDIVLMDGSTIIE